MKIIFQLTGAVKMGSKPLGQLQLLAKAPVDLGDVEFKLSFDRTGDKHLSNILIKHYGQKEYDRLLKKKELLRGRQIFLAVE